MINKPQKSPTPNLKIKKLYCIGRQMHQLKFFSHIEKFHFTPQLIKSNVLNKIKSHNRLHNHRISRITKPFFNKIVCFLR